MLEVGGWNIQTEYRCQGLHASKTELKAKETLTVTAQIANTFLDGSRVTLVVDGQPVRTKWAWARGGRIDPVTFEVNFSATGTHTVSVGDRHVEVRVSE